VSTVIISGSRRLRAAGFCRPGRGAGGLLRLPEDRLPALCRGEDELRAREPPAIEAEIDRRPAPLAEQDRRLLDDLRLGRPRLLEAVAVNARSRRPRRPRFQHEHVLEWQPHEVRQAAVFLSVAGHHERGGVARRGTTHAAAAWYSWISPPNTSRRRIPAGGEPRASGGSQAGGVSPSDRCGRSAL
jgi:hypothetical protein